MSTDTVTWSPFQGAFFDAALEMVGERAAYKRRTGNNIALLLRARAGTGKTFSAIEMISRVKRANPGLRILFTVFAKRNASEMEKKVVKAGLASMRPGKWGPVMSTVGGGTIDVLTLNSLGLRSLKALWGLNVKTDLGKKHERAVYDRFLPPVGKEAGEMRLKDRKGVEKFISGCQAYLASTDAEMEAVMRNEDLQIEWDTGAWPVAEMFRATRQILKAFEEPRSNINFPWQVFTPAKCGNKYGNYDLVVVDEAQDMSPAKMRLCELALAPEGAIVAIGDPAQSIFGFAGADSASISNFKAKWDPKVLSLPLTYRCPRVVVEHVRNVVPDYQAHESNTEGEIVQGDVPYMHANWRVNDVCISRTNAPLVRHCLAAWRGNIPAMVLGKEFAEELEKLLKDSHKTTVIEFLAWLGEYEMEEGERLRAMKREEACEKLADVCETLEALTEGLKTVDQVMERMERLFVEDPRVGCLLFTSTHKFKGGEAHRVWQFVDTYKPSGRQYAADDDVRADDCLYYVSCTRVHGDVNVPGSGVLFQIPVKEDKGRAAPKAAKAPPPANEGFIDVDFWETKQLPAADEDETDEVVTAAPILRTTPALPAPQPSVLDISAPPSRRSSSPVLLDISAPPSRRRK